MATRPCTTACSPLVGWVKIALATHRGVPGHLPAVTDIACDLSQSGSRLHIELSRFRQIDSVSVDYFGGSSMHKLAGAMLAVVVSGTAYAHPGGLDKQGCHRDKKNGGYHCHRPPSTDVDRAPQDSSPKPLVSSSSYPNCAAARAAGAAPIRRGEPGYGKHLDRDGDGVACE